MSTSCRTAVNLCVCSINRRSKRSNHILKPCSSYIASRNSYVHDDAAAVLLLFITAVVSSSRVPDYCLQNAKVSSVRAFVLSFVCHAQLVCRSLLVLVALHSSTRSISGFNTAVAVEYCCTPSTPGFCAAGTAEYSSSSPVSTASTQSTQILPSSSSILGSITYTRYLVL